MKYFSIIALLLLLACSKSKQADGQAETKEVSFLALGDSYTIGEGVQQNESFPYQLAAQLKKSNGLKIKPRVVARTGWTTDELQAAINNENLKQHFNLVTLLIGVNNQYRGYSINQYRQTFKTLLTQAIAFSNGNPKNVYVLSIPDWGVTPFGRNSGKSAALIAAEIDAFNAANREESMALGVTYVDITAISRKALSDRSLIAGDGLHPSGKMYAEWVTLFIDSIK